VLGRYPLGRCRCSYSPKCLEGAFCELRLHGVSRRLAASNGLAPSLVGLSKGGPRTSRDIPIPVGIALVLGRAPTLRATPTNGSLRAPAEGLSTEGRERGVLWTSPVTDSPSFACIVFWALRWLGSSLPFSEVSERAHQRKPEPLAGGPGPKARLLEGVPSVCGGGAYCEALRPRTTLSAAKPEAISPAAAAPAIGATGGPPVEASALAVALAVALAEALAEADALAVDPK